VVVATECVLLLLGLDVDPMVVVDSMNLKH
jgi:hypothetical protein